MKFYETWAYYRDAVYYTFLLAKFHYIPISRSRVALPFVITIIFIYALQHIAVLQQRLLSHLIGLHTKCILNTILEFGNVLRLRRVNFRFDEPAKQEVASRQVK